MIDAQIYKILTYIYVVFIESLGSHWILSVIPQIVTNNFHVSDPQEKSSVGGQFFTFFFIGLISGSLVWPSVVRFIAKRDCILIGLLGQAFTNFMVGRSNSLTVMFFWRFLFGFFHCINTIGKDFLYEFAHSQHRQLIFTLRSIAVLIASFFGPIFGYMIYYSTQQSLDKSLMYISLLILSSAVLFFIAFYIVAPNQRPLENQNEESQHLMEEDSGIHNDVQVQKLVQIPLSIMLSHIFKTKDLRNLVLGFWLVFSIYNTQMFLAVFYIETAWSDYGLGLTDRQVSLLVLVIFVPTLCVFILSSALIPKHVSIFAYFRFIIVANIILLVLMPGLRDLLDGFSYQPRMQLIYSFLGIALTFNPNLISPFLNYHMNNKIPKNGRTSFNSITFIGCSCCVILMFSTIVPLFSISMFDSRFTNYAPYNKYTCFVIMDVLLIIGGILLRRPKEK